MTNDSEKIRQQCKRLQHNCAYILHQAEILQNFALQKKKENIIKENMRKNVSPVGCPHPFYALLPGLQLTPPPMFDNLVLS
jgi:hypothetical protein